MANQNFLTNLPWILLFLISVAIFFAVIELGFRYGKSRHTKEGASQLKSETGTALAALLGLLAFMLAITFSIVESRFQQRKLLILREANAIGTTYLRTAFVTEPQRSNIRQALANYVESRIEVAESGVLGDELQRAIKEASEIHQYMWSQAVSAVNQTPDSFLGGLFIQSLNELIDLHEERVTVSGYRLPPPLVRILYLVAICAMAMLGLYFGLEGSRNWVATGFLVLAFTAIILLILDMDQIRPHRFEIGQQALENVQESIREDPP